jgi:DtxR family transcriptional regulator, Mn-dependent transcriptional regulator
MEEDPKLSESLEDYLEVILDLEETHKVARAKDIAEKLGIQRGSVTGALKSLEEKNLINYSPYSFITLTDRGARIAKTITRRHHVLKDFLIKVLQLNGETAEVTACRMEHAVDEASIDRLVSFVEYIDHCPRTGSDWIQSFLDRCKNVSKSWADCDRCIDTCKARHQENKGL